MSLAGVQNGVKSMSRRMTSVAKSANPQSNIAEDFIRWRPSGRFLVRLLASLLLIRVGAYLLRSAVRRVLRSN